MTQSFLMHHVRTNREYYVNSSSQALFFLNKLYDYDFLDRNYSNSYLFSDNLKRQLNAFELNILHIYNDHSIVEVGNGVSVKSKLFYSLNYYKRHTKNSGSSFVKYAHSNNYFYGQILYFLHYNNIFYAVINIYNIKDMQLFDLED